MLLPSKCHLLDETENKLIDVKTFKMSLAQLIERGNC